MSLTIKLQDGEVMCVPGGGPSAYKPGDEVIIHWGSMQGAEKAMIVPAKVEWNWKHKTFRDRISVFDNRITLIDFLNGIALEESGNRRAYRRLSYDHKNKFVLVHGGFDNVAYFGEDVYAAYEEYVAWSIVT